MTLEKDIFKKGSTTYYFSSKLFPKSIRQDVFKLYSFVRVADDYVDSIPQNKKEFKTLRQHSEDALAELNFDTKHSSSDSLNDRVVKNIIYLVQKYELEKEWVVSFLDSMQADMDSRTYETIDGSLWYVYGSAEVIGLMMAKIMGLPEQANAYATTQGRAMQWINFIRDIDEDNNLGRCYFPAEDLKKFGLRNLSKKSAQANPENFSGFINYQLKQYKVWQRQAKAGFKYVPKRLLIPLQTAVDMFNWTAREIQKNPMIIFDKKVKPSKRQIIRASVKNIL